MTKEIWQRIEELRVQKENIVLMTIVSGEGSVPRKAGAYMFLSESGKQYGTIGGGAAEYRALRIAQELLEEINAKTGPLKEETIQTNTRERFDKNKPVLKQFRMDGQEVFSQNMICGGQIQVLFTPILKEDSGADKWIDEGIRLSKAQEKFFFLLPLQEAHAKVQVISATKLDENLKEGYLPELYSAVLSADKIILETDRGKIYAEQFGNVGKVYLFGAGHISKALVPLLESIQFPCVVLDDREELLTKERFEKAMECRLVDYQDIAKYVSVKEDDYVLILTPDHSFDYEVERFALQTNAFYIGMVGSKRKIAISHEKLRLEGFDDVMLGRVHAPIGLSIGSRTPEEIAISIAAEMIAVRSHQR